MALLLCGALLGLTRRPNSSDQLRILACAVLLSLVGQELIDIFRQASCPTRPLHFIHTQSPRMTHRVSRYVCHTCGIAVKTKVGHSCGMARDDLHFRLRIPEALKNRVEKAAKSNHRSMTAEIVAALEERYPAPELDGPEILNALWQELASEPDKGKHPKLIAKANQNLAKVASTVRVAAVTSEGNLELSFSPASSNHTPTPHHAEPHQPAPRQAGLGHVAKDPEPRQAGLSDDTRPPQKRKRKINIEGKPDSSTD